MDEKAGLLYRLHVFRPQHRAAAEREHDALPLRQLPDVRGLAVAEIGLALVREDVRDLFALPGLEVLVGVDEVQPGQAGELAADRSLAAAHEAAQHDIALAVLFVQALDRHFAVGAAQDGLARLRLKLHARPDGLRVRGLHDQHEQPVPRFGFLWVRELHGGGHGRVIDRVEHIFGLVRQKMQRGGVLLGEHADRRGVEHDLDVARDVPPAEHRHMRARDRSAQLLLQRRRLFHATPGDGQICALRHAVVRHDRRRAAVAQQQHLFAAQLDAIPRKGFGKAQDVGIVAGGLSVPEGDRVDRVQVARGGVHRVQQRDDRFFVGDGAVDAAQLGLGQMKRLFERLGRHGHADVVRVLSGCGEQLRVQLGAHGVAERPAEQRIGRLFRLESAEFLHGQQHVPQPPNCPSVSKKPG